MVLFDGSRASLLGSLGVLSLLALRYLVIWLTTRRGRAPQSGGLGWTRSSVAAGLAVLVVAPVIVLFGSGTPDAVTRSVNIVRPPSTSSGSGGSNPAQPAPTGPAPSTGTGTFEARANAWRAVIDWLFDDGLSRPVLGVGFGPHYMQLSGADVELFGEFPDPSVRAVHNYGINTWARLGIVGLLLVAAIAALAVIGGFRLLIRARTVPDLDLLAAFLVVAIPLTAMLGVVLEGPYAAIPYFWAVGYIGARTVEAGMWRRLRLPWGLT
jgi:O-antigen ligase